MMDRRGHERMLRGKVIAASFRTSLSVKYLAAPLGLFFLLDVWVVCAFKFLLVPFRIHPSATFAVSSLS